MEILKKWREKPLTISEFEDLWQMNNKIEVAESLIYTLRDAENISLNDKIKFLAGLVREWDDAWYIWHHLSSCSRSLPAWFHGSRNGELNALALKTFLELVPAQNDEFECECKIVLKALGDILLSDRGKKGWENKIKTFVHSLLNTKKKEEMDNDLIDLMGGALVYNGMFEELVNYDLIEDEVVEKLTTQILHSFDLTKEKSYEFVVYPEYIKKALKENKEPHAVSVLLRLLAKRGELEKVFQVEA